MIHEDCFAYWPSRCKALKRMVCAEQDYCKFYKTKEQHKTDYLIVKRESESFTAFHPKNF